MNKKTISENLRYFRFPKNKIKDLTKEIHKNKHLGIHFIDPTHEEMPPTDFSGILILPESIAFYKKGKFHREDGPAIYLQNKSEYWFINGDLHREDGPAEKVYLEKEYYTGYYINNKLHREDGPALTFYKIKNNAIITEEWFFNNKRHREDGPSLILHRKNKKPKNIYYINGREVRKKDFKIHKKFSKKIANAILSTESSKKIKKLA